MNKPKVYFWSSLNRFGIQIISFIGNVLIARILTPDDYGLVAMLSIVLSIAWNFTDSGLSDFLIKKSDADHIDFSTVVVFNIFVGTIMYLLIYATAPLIADYFGRNELVAISRVIGLSILLKAVTVTEFTKLRKELNFKTTTIIELSSNIISLIVAYSFALYGYGYWALVVQILTLGLCNIIMLLLISKWKLILFFSWDRFVIMRSYSLDLLISYFTNQIGQNLYSVFIGKYNPTSVLGFYRQGQKLRDVPLMGLNSIMLSTTYPILAKEIDIKKRKAMYVSLLSKFSLIHFITSTVLLGTALPLISLLFGEKWLPTVPIYQLLVISYLLLPFTTINSNIIKVLGKSKLYRNLTIVRNSLLFIALLITMKQDVSIIIIGQIIAWFCSAFIDIYYCGKEINYGLLFQLKIIATHIWRPIISLLVSYFGSISFNGDLQRLLLFIIEYFIIFVVLSEITRYDEYNKIKKFILLRFK